MTEKTKANADNKAKAAKATPTDPAEAAPVALASKTPPPKSQTAPKRKGKGAGKAKTSKPVRKEGDDLLPFRPFQAPAKPEDLWRRWAEVDENYYRAAALVAFGRSLLGEMLAVIARWGEVAVAVDLGGVSDGCEGDWLEPLEAIDEAMHTMRDSIFQTRGIGPATPTEGGAE